MRLFHINGIAKRIVYTAFCLAAVIWVWAGDTMPAQPFCLFHRLTGIPCCGCGGLRAANLLLHGKLAQAVIMNPLAVIAIVSFFVGMLIWWLDYFRNTQMLQRLLHSKWHPSAYIVAMFLFIGNWIWNIYKDL